MYASWNTSFLSIYVSFPLKFIFKNIAEIFFEVETKLNSKCCELIFKELLLVDLG